MTKNLFSPMDIDALGEMMNISLGSSATAVSNMLDHRVDITTPQVEVVDVKDFVLGKLEPAMGVKISYVEGLDGSNIMLLRRNDVKVIVDILMGSETAEEDFELNELTISAVCEVMNQMMGAAATAMSEFLGFPVNISTPEPFDLDDVERFKADHFPKGADTIVVVKFSLKIENALESEFMNVMSVGLAKELLKGLGLGDDDDEEFTPILPMESSEESSGSRPLTQEEIEQLISGGLPAESEPPKEEPSGGRSLSQEEIEKLLSGNMGSEPEPVKEEASSNRMLSQEEIEKMLQQETAPQAAPQSNPQAPAAPQNPGQGAAQNTAQMPPQGYPMPTPEQMQAMGMPPYFAGYPGYMPQMYWQMPPQAPQQPIEPKVINTQPVAMPEMEQTISLGKEQAENLELIMEVPLQVTVEIGRTRRKVQDILEFAKGSLVVLDKLAGDQVDLFVNGKCIARGDVVVVDDNFGVRITEIVQNPSLEMPVKK